MTMARKAVAAVLTAGLAALTMWLYSVKPHIEARLQHPLVSKGRIGTAVGTTDFSVKVAKVDVASAISKPSFLDKGKVMKSLGVFVIVQTQIKSNKKPFTPGHVRLVTRGGVAYDESGRADLPDTSSEFQPMLWAPATFIFEIPKDRLAGARLVVGTADLINNLSGETSVDLGISGDQAARLASHPTPDYELKTS
ncbi:hypothetical protein [Actinoallomurus acaciae]|uniref:DUF4352 domain-containing protein n=1 Tax=Actinoallomurus acaciae TaxID=502577 RepID=A0ABV5YM04_9ACTN